MYQDDNMAFSEKRFIFSDDFYSNLEKAEKNESNDNLANNTTSSNIVMPNIIPVNNNINNQVDIQESVPTYNNEVVNNTISEPIQNQEEQLISVPTYNNEVVNNNILEPVQNQEEQLISVPTYNNEVVNNTIPEPVQNQEEQLISVPTYNNEVVNNTVPEPVQNQEEQLISVQSNEIKTDNIPYYNNIDNNNINVETGINYNLERDLLNIEKEKEDKYSFILPTEDKPEKITYRAIRRPVQNNNITYAPEPTLNNKVEETEVKEEQPVDLNEFIADQRKITNQNIVEEEWTPPTQPTPVYITEKIDYFKEEPKEEEEEIIKSTILDELRKKEAETGKISILARYGEDFCSYDYITNPAIGRDEEIKQLGLILITPEKSAILVGKPGIGKTSIVEGLAYRIQRNKIPNVLKGYSIISIKTTSLLGTLPNGETRLQTLIDELKELDKIILFIDEIHMLMGATNESGLDFANMFKESLGRGNIKMIGATTSDEYERYVLRDKAFVRRFQKVDVEEPTQEQTVDILMGTLPKIEKKSNAKLKYTHYIQVEIMKFIVSITSEYKRIYGIGSRYPDICIGLLNNAFSEAIFDNRNEVGIKDIRKAISTSKNIYPDVIKKELINFDEQFKKIIEEE